MEAIKILVCEDEPLISNRLIRFIGNVANKPVKIDSVFTLSEALKSLSINNIDLLFLDLNLHGKDGFEILKRLASESFHTIIVSAYTDRAIEAYEYGVLDFLGKPFTQDRVKKAMERFEKDNPEANNYIKYVAVRNRKGIDFINIKNINYIKASGIYSELVLLDGSVKVYDKPMNQLLKLLPDNFIRIHKSFIVPLEHINSIKKRNVNSYDALLKSGDKISISRNMRKELIAKTSS